MKTVPIERVATAAELTDERARHERAWTGRTFLRTLHELCQQAAILVPCGHCWARRGTPCVTGPAGYHVARFARAFRRGLLAEGELGGVLDGLDVFTNATIVRDGAR